MLLFGVNKKLFKDKKYTLQEFVKDVKHMLINVGSCEQYKVDVEAGGYLLLSLSKEEKAAKETGFQRIELSQI